MGPDPRANCESSQKSNTAGEQNFFSKIRQEEKRIIPEKRNERNESNPWRPHRCPMPCPHRVSRLQAQRTARRRIRSERRAPAPRTKQRQGQRRCPWAGPHLRPTTRPGVRLLRITREQAPLFFSAMTTRRVIDAAFPHVPDAGLSFQCPDFPSLLRQIQRVKQSQVCENWGARFFVLVYPLIAWG